MWIGLNIFTLVGGPHCQRGALVQRAEWAEYFHMMQRADWIEYFHISWSHCQCGALVQRAEWAEYIT